MNRSALTYPTPQVFQSTFDPEAIKRRAARDPATDPVELRRLFDIRPLTRNALTDALAYNPSMPLEVLTQLIEEAPSAFCRNPIAPMVSLEMPDFVEKVSPLGLARLLRSPRAPEHLVHQIAEGVGFLDYLTETARQHIQYRQPILDREWSDAVRQFLWQELHAVAEEDQKRIVAELAEIGVIPAAMAATVEISELPAPEDYEKFRGKLSPIQAQTLEQGYFRPPLHGMPSIATGDSLFAYIGATFNPSFPSALLLEWHRHPDIAAAIARNPTAPPDVLLRLAKNSDIQIRRMTLHNPSCPIEARLICCKFVLSQLLNQSADSYLHRQHISWHYPKPWSFGRFFALWKAPEVLRRPFFNRFATSPMWEDRLAAVIAIDHRPNGQPMKPKHRVLLEQLSNDGICLVRAAARARLRGETFSLEEM